MITKQTPLNDRVIVQRLEEEAVSKLIVTEVRTDKPMRAKVIAVGPGRMNEAGTARVPMSVKAGDEVLIGKYTGVEYNETDPKNNFKTTTYAIIREDEILTRFEKGKK